MVDSEDSKKIGPESIFSSKDEPEDGGWGFLSRWGSFRAF